MAYRKIIPKAEQEPTAFWYNYRTCKIEEIAGEPTNPGDYVPQAGGRQMYDLFREKGMAPMEALETVLSIVVGVKKPERSTQQFRELSES